MDIYEKALQKLKLDSYNEMQQEAFQSIEEGGDTLLISQTGSGKTLAFLLPLSEKINFLNGTQVLIVAPTRELSLQITTVLGSLGLGLNITCCYGGHPIHKEKKALQSGPEVVIGTPGRILDHLDRATLAQEKIKYVVLDEFDKTLEMGFHQQMKRILGYFKSKPQYVLTSATKGIQIPSFVPLKKLKTLDYVSEQKIDGLSISKVISPTKDKLETLTNLVAEIGNESTFIFVNFRDSAARISEELSKQKIPNDQFHGGLDQIARENVLSKVRNGSTRILVTTDLAGRGLDIPQVRNVIHYHAPQDKETYIHRNGRTARMGASGDVYFITSAEEELPEFISLETPLFKPNITSTSVKLNTPQWRTLMINKGKRDKIRKIDIVGFLSKIGGLSKDDLGLVEVKENYSLAAVSSNKIKGAIRNTDRQKVKGKKALVREL